MRKITTRETHHGNSGERRVLPAGLLVEVHKATNLPADSDIKWWAQPVFGHPWPVETAQWAEDAGVGLRTDDVTEAPLCCPFGVTLGYPCRICQSSALTANNPKTSKQARRKPYPYRKGDKVCNVYTGKTFVVKKDGYWQNYAGGDTSDYTVELEATEDQPTPWNKSSNLCFVD